MLVFGFNDYGQLGLGHNISQNKPQILMQGIAIRQIACGNDHTIILKKTMMCSFLDDNNIWSIRIRT